jgi:P-type Cu2+ transporter
MNSPNSVAPNCFHCGVPISAKNSDICVTVGGELRPVCCIGCRESAAWIDKIGMADYYQVRQQGGIVLGVENSPSAERQSDLLLSGLGQQGPHQEWLRPELLRHVVRQLDAGLSEVCLLVEGVRCNGCVLFIERMLMQLIGVKQVQVNALTRRARIIFDEQTISLVQLLDQLTCFGYAPRPLDSQALDDARRDESRDFVKRLVVAGFGMMQAMMFALIIYLGSEEEVSGATLELFRWLGFLVATPVVLYSAQPFFKGALRGLRGRELNMDVPISLAIALIYVASLYQAKSGGAEVYFDSVSMLIFFLLTGRYLEMRVRHRAMDSTDALARLTPSSAERQLSDGSFEKVGVHELSVGDVVRVQDGAHIPADGTLVSSRGQTDESLLSGESTLQAKRDGDELIAGSVAVGSSLLFSVTRCGADTFLATLANLATRAQSTRPRLAQAGQKAAARFVIRVLSLTLVTAVGWFVVQPERALEASLAVLVVSCPCAFALAVPAAITRMISVLARRGVLIVEPDVIENLAEFDCAVFDKTGTLTTPSVTVNSTAADIRSDDAVLFAASLAQESRHPLSKALSKALAQTNTGERMHVQDVVVEAGKGISGSLGARHYRLGRADFALGEGVEEALTDQSSDSQLPSTQGASVARNTTDIVLTQVLDSGDVSLVATFGISESLRVDAATTVKALQQDNVECELLSGDGEDRVKVIASLLALPHWRSRQLPADKLDRITALQQSGKRVLAIGDGSNDAPVLAGADVSVALASGTDLAQAQADVVLCSDRLEGLRESRQVAQQALMILRQNQRWALAYNIMAMPLAAFGFVPPWLAAIGMSTSSLIVVLNAMRIGRGMFDGNHEHEAEQLAEQMPSSRLR